MRNTSTTRVSKITHMFVIGASAGGVESLREIVSSLPADFPATICVVLHIPSYQKSSLADILGRCGPLTVIQPTDCTKIEAGRIYVARPDHHLLVEKGRLAIKRG